MLGISLCDEARQGFACNVCIWPYVAEDKATLSSVPFGDDRLNPSAVPRIAGHDDWIFVATWLDLGGHDGWISVATMNWIPVATMGRNTHRVLEIAKVLDRRVPGASPRAR